MIKQETPNSHGCRNPQEENKAQQEKHYSRLTILPFVRCKMRLIPTLCAFVLFVCESGIKKSFSTFYCKVGTYLPVGAPMQEGRSTNKSKNVFIFRNSFMEYNQNLKIMKYL